MHSSRILILESEYLSKLDDAILKNINKYGDEINKAIKSSIEISPNTVFKNGFTDISQAVSEHINVFDKARQMANLFQSNQQNMANLFNDGQSNLVKAINSITKEETDLIMSGDSLPENMVALRDGLKEFSVLFLRFRMNMVDLMAFSDETAYLTLKSDLLKNLDITTKNTDGVVVSVNKQELSDIWKAIKTTEDDVRRIEETVHQQWLNQNLLLKQLDQTTQSVQKMVNIMTKEIYIEAQKWSDRGKWIGLLASIVTILLMIGLSLFIVKQITQPVNEMIKGIGQMVKGDMNVKINTTSRDEIGHMAMALSEMADIQKQRALLTESISNGNLNHDVGVASDQDVLGKALFKMVQNLNKVLHQVRIVSAQVTDGASHISGYSQTLSQGASEQAASLQEITSSMLQIGQQTQINAENAKNANQLASDTKQTAENGNQKMKHMITAMNDINDSGRAIAKIIKTIDDIAFQTNLLALNASIEAARAGKHGKGFSVVAQEVRNLASKSANAASDTAEMIDGVIKKLDTGTLLFRETANALEDILTYISKVAVLVNEISVASNEQAQGISQINVGLSQIEQVTQHNTANAEQTASATVELSHHADRLTKLLLQFKLTNSNEI